MPFNADKLVQGMQGKTLQSAIAIFPEPPCDLEKLWERICSEWFPISGYEQVEGPNSSARHQS
ncbi:hypothetical protein DUZ99_10140 [Xylanibacillus composti]|nr:hypothetical protein [Xylanibacillus composti]